MSTKFLKVGVVGCGLITQTAHLPELLKCKGAKVVAVCDRNEELAKKVAKDSRIKSYYTDLFQMLKGEQLDMVDICTPTPTHAPLAIQAMEAGCHVLTEKPMALNVNEADEMIKAAKAKGVKLCVTHDMLFGLGAMRMREYLIRGTLGDILGVEIKQFRPANVPALVNAQHWMHTLPGGLIIGDAMIHPLYLARSILGDLEPKMAFTSKTGTIPHLSFDEVHVYLKSNQRVATIITCYNSCGTAVILDIFGTESNLHCELFNSILFTYKGIRSHRGDSKSRYAMYNLSQCIQILQSTIYSGVRALLGQYGGHRNLIDKFIESILNDTEPPVTAKDGREIVRMVEQVVRLCKQT